MFVDSVEELAKVVEAVKDLPKVKSIITWDDATASKYSVDKRVIPWSAIQKDVLEEATLKHRIKLHSPDQITTLVYTSGTTGPPKVGELNFLLYLIQST